MLYLLEAAEKEKKEVKSNGSTENRAISNNNVESITERRKNILQAQARKKILSASTKLNW